MLLGLAVKYLSLNQGEQNIDHVCSCVGLNSTPHILTINATTHVHCYRRVGKINHGCSLVSAPHTVNMAVWVDLCFKCNITKWIFHLHKCCRLGHNKGTIMKIETTCFKTPNSLIINIAVECMSKLQHTECFLILWCICILSKIFFLHCLLIVLEWFGFVIDFPLIYLHGLFIAREAREWWYTEKQGKRAI